MIQPLKRTGKTPVKTKAVKTIVQEMDNIDSSVPLTQFRSEYYSIADSLNILWNISIDRELIHGFSVPTRGESEYKAIILQMRQLLDRAGVVVKKNVGHWE